MIPAHIEGLLKKYRDGKLTLTERAALFRWYNEQAKEETTFDANDLQHRLHRIEQNLPHRQHTARINRRPWYAWTAAAVLVTSLCSIWFITSDYQKNTPELIVNVDSTATPELITADNQRLALNSIQPGDSILLDQVLLYRTDDGYLAYQYLGDTNQQTAPYQVQTPVGSDIKLLLPDGTRVWLNAASTLSFPLQSSTAPRTVHLQGEAYFEVSKVTNLAHHGFLKFTVHTDRQVVEVLGTKFNVKSFTDDPVTSTSLFEGSVKVQTLKTDRTADKSVILKPGQESIYDKTNGGLDFRSIADKGAQSWRDGYFTFQGESLTQVCHQLSRWYPVEFDIEEKLPEGQYHGDIPKSYSLNEVLQILIQNNMRYTIRNVDDKIIVRLTNK